MAGGRERGRVVEHFAGLVDPRAERAQRHELLDIIVITICGVICGADNWVEIEEFGNARLEWLSRFLRLPNGIPSHDTFGRVFSRLDPDQFGACFMNWARSVAELTQGEVVAIDGKTLRRCHDRGQGRAPLHLVSAWAAQNHLVLGQTRTQAHSNEITAIPQLLALLELRGCIITIDAMGCQTEIAQQIVDGGADYLLAVKSNQGELYGNIQDLFQMAAQEGSLAEEPVYHRPDYHRPDYHRPDYHRPDYHRQVDKGHGRLETRECWVITDPAELAYVDPHRRWLGLKSVAKVCYRRGVHPQAPQQAPPQAPRKAPTETRYYICSYQPAAASLLQASRQHWGIENSLHWVLDMAFDEDHCRVRTGHADQNLAVVRHLTLNLLKQERTAKVGIKAKRKKAGWDHNYLLKVLAI